MTKDWIKKFGEVIEENERREKTRKRLLRIGGSLYLTLIPLMLISVYLYHELIWAIIVILPLSVLIIISSAYFRRKKTFLYWSDIILYDLYIVTNKIEKYQKSKSQKNRKELKIEIMKILQGVERLAQNIEKNAERYIEPDYNIESATYLKDHVYALNYAIEKNVEITEKMLNSVREYCKERMDLIETYQKDNIKLKSTTLAITAKAINNKLTVLNGGYRFEIFRNALLSTQLIFYVFIITIGIILTFCFILPNLSDFSNDALLIAGSASWMGLSAMGISVLWSIKKETGRT